MKVLMSDGTTRELTPEEVAAEQVRAQQALDWLTDATAHDERVAAAQADFERRFSVVARDVAIIKEGFRSLSGLYRIDAARLDAIEAALRTAGLLPVVAEQTEE